MNNSCFTGFHHLKPAYKINNFFFCQCQSNNNDKIDVDVCRIANKCIHEKSLDFGHSNSRSRLDIWQTFNEQILKHRRKRISIKVLETSAIPVDSNKKKKNIRSTIVAFECESISFCTFIFTSFRETSLYFRHLKFKEKN